MIDALKAVAKRHWPALRLRTILMATLLFVAALPGVGAVFLRVYENTLVRQTESELIAQSAALVATAEALQPGASSRAPPDPRDFRPEPPSIDLGSTPILPERPAPVATGSTPDLSTVRLAAALSPVIAATKRTTLASIVLLDRAGRIAGDRSLAALPEVRAALGGSARTVLRRNGSYRPRYSFEWLSRASAIRIHHARPIRSRNEVVGVLLLSRSPRALFRGIYQDRGKIALGVGLIFAVLVVLTGLLSRGIARPIEALSAATRGVASGSGGIPEPPVTAAIEIRALYEDFAIMAEAIARRSRYLRDFAASVSHEFKTPLAGIRGAIELLEDHGASMSADERARFLANITADADRLSQLVTRLLDLARADMTQPAIDVVAGIAAPANRVADAMRGRDFVVELALPDDLPSVAAPETTIEAALTALIENSRQAGAGRLRVAAAHEGDQVTLSVTDDGPGIAEADRVRLFEPFFTTRRASGGTGLGLPIARSLVEASRGEIRLADSSGGSRFEIVLPVAA